MAPGAEQVSPRALLHNPPQVSLLRAHDSCNGKRIKVVVNNNLFIEVEALLQNLNKVFKSFLFLLCNKKYTYATYFSKIKLILLKIYTYLPFFYYLIYKVRDSIFLN